eukprot:TRINITY_DN47728_c0_g1_i1.p2 TRINITY_DN47728_c0_g1~~TRINITY_DN47728_c0_g1_i1.p2  ORF type:complete len:169 (+),score=75.73 TRINITY_DN47728_c0_g1_i1:56-508(+)
MAEEWSANLLGEADAVKIAREAKRVAVLGVRSAKYDSRPAHFVAAHLRGCGVEIIPVPTHPECSKEESILDGKVCTLQDLVGGPQIDIVDVFRKPEDVAAHVDDLIAVRPSCVWLQSGIRNDEAAEKLAREGIKVVQDRCLKVDRGEASL